MYQQILLTPRERELVLELLESERNLLPSEIHHTDSREMHRLLKERMQAVDDLIQRLRTSPPPH